MKQVLLVNKQKIDGIKRKKLEKKILVNQVDCMHKALISLPQNTKSYNTATSPQPFHSM